MEKEAYEGFTLYDHEPVTGSFRGEVLYGLRSKPKKLPCKFFYDERGSRLFQQICELEEYYLTRTEIGILRENISEIASLVGPNCLLVEFGSGSGLKTRMLLEHLDSPVAYIPIDIEKATLVSASRKLTRIFPELEVMPVCADFNSPIELPPVAGASEKTVAFFPGSTIGNLEPAEAVSFMRNVSALCDGGGGLLIGVDLKKDAEILEAAYNDSAGVTAAFNVNLMVRIKREFDADFPLDGFAHDAFYNEALGRIEMHIVSRKEQTIKLGQDEIHFDRGERIITEYSYKYDLDGFQDQAERAGFGVESVWVDNDKLFSVQYLGVNSDSRGHASPEPIQGIRG